MWTKIPLAQQLPVLIQQLEFARQNQKPVILHTKRTERLMLEIIKAYPDLKFLVHWYSDAESIDEYIQAGCLFSIGIDLMGNAVSTAIVKKAPVEQLLIESDGMDSIEWAYAGQKASFDQYLTLLNQNMDIIAQMKQMPVAILGQKMQENLAAFLKNKN